MPMPRLIATVSFLDCRPLVEWFSAPDGAARTTLSGALPCRQTALLAEGDANVALLPTMEILRGRATGSSEILGYRLSGQRGRRQIVPPQTVGRTEPCGGWPRFARVGGPSSRVAGRDGGYPAGVRRGQSPARPVGAAGRGRAGHR